jgi:hypothetical protein
MDADVMDGCAAVRVATDPDALTPFTVTCADIVPAFTFPSGVLNAIAAWVSFTEDKDVISNVLAGANM